MTITDKRIIQLALDARAAGLPCPRFVDPALDTISTAVYRGELDETPSPPKTGRPAKAPEDRQRLHGLRFSDREWAVVVAAAAAAGLAPAVYVREAALRATEEDR